MLAAVANQSAQMLIAHPTGNQNLRNALKSLAEQSIPCEFWTTLYWSEAYRANPMLPGGLREQLLRRCYTELDPAQVRTHAWREAVRLGLRATPLARLLSQGEQFFSILRVYEDFDRRVARRIRQLRPKLVYAYEGGARNSFRAAHAVGAQACYELPSGYWYWEQELLSNEARRNPQLANLLPKIGDSRRHMEWKDAELELADKVVVGSQYVRRTLQGVVDEEKIVVVPYGAPPPMAPRQVGRAADRPLQVLFVGQLTQRKGIGYLLDAVDQMAGKVELTMVGAPFAANVRVDEACRRFRWYPSLPHRRVMDLMRGADVLVLPSLAEAFGLVVTEALAAGVPVIVTPNTGSSEVVTDGVNGYIVPIADADAIADKLEVLHRDRDLLAQMSVGAQSAAARSSWENYRADWARMIMDALC